MLGKEKAIFFLLLQNFTVPLAWVKNVSTDEMKVRRPSINFGVFTIRN
jgi:hypothetical protein